MPHINHVIIFLISSNFFIQIAGGFVAPVLAIFVVDFVEGGSVAVAGFAVGIYWLVKAVLQIFVGIRLDKIDGEDDDYLSLIIGQSIMGIAPFLYLMIDTVAGLYAVQLLMAIGGAFSVPPWAAMYSRHLDANEESFEWSLNSSISFGLGYGGAGIVGGLIVENFGFEVLFVTAGIFGIMSAVILTPLYHNLKKKLVTP